MNVFFKNRLPILLRLYITLVLCGIPLTQLAATPVFSEQDVSNAILKKAEAKYRSGDFEAALGILDGFLKRKDISQAEKEQAFLLRTRINIAADYLDHAKADIQHLIEFNPDLELDSLKVKPPIVYSLFKDGRSAYLDSMRKDIAAKLVKDPNYVLPLEFALSDTISKIYAQEKAALAPTPPDSGLAEGGKDEKKGGGKKTLLYAAGGIALVAGVVFVLSGSGPTSEPDPTLPGPPAYPNEP